MDEREVRERLRLLQTQHRALDTVLADPGEQTGEQPGERSSMHAANDHDEAAEAMPIPLHEPLGLSDTIGRMRAKKLKLRLRDEICVLESLLIPDILA